MRRIIAALLTMVLLASAVYAQAEDEEETIVYDEVELEEESPEEDAEPGTVPERQNLPLQTGRFPV